MNGTVVMMMIFFGLCFLPSCFPHLYYYITTGLTWKAAQDYCRSKYTDLATIHTEQEQTKLNQLLQSQLYVWIGLHADTDAWSWSLENQDYYGLGEAGFRMWAPFEPNDDGNYQVCVLMTTAGEWADGLCTWELPFICYSATAGAESTSSIFFLINDLKNWTEAQSYCRIHYTDLASVRNQAENDQMSMMLTQGAWIGLYRNSWKWSDGSSLSFSYWYPGHAPTATTTDSCVAAFYSKWTNRDCTFHYYFLCFVAQVRKQVVRVVLKQTDFSVAMEQLKEDILQKFDQRLKDKDLDEYVRMTWVEQPNGKVFCKKNTNTNEEETCPFK